MNTATENACAKINLTLDVVGESRGFHLLDMLVATVDLCDTVTVTERADGKITCLMDGKPADENNSAVRAARLVRDTFKTCGFDISITKKIPLAGGLGGSTADGVAVIRAAAKLLGISKKEITANWLLGIGSDAPCMYNDGVKRVRGIGEKVDFIDIELPYKVGFIAGSGVDTSLAYATFDSLKRRGGDNTERLMKGLYNQGFDIADYLGNDLYFAAVLLNPKIKTAMDKISGCGARAVNMSGSGSTVYGLFSDKVADGLQSTQFKK